MITMFPQEVKAQAALLFLDRSRLLQSPAFADENVVSSI